MSKPLSGKTALVTGGSRGIGRGIARRLAEDGATVALTYNAGRDGADETVAAIEGSGGKAFALQADLADADAIPALFDRLDRELVEHSGDTTIDILVNNAGGSGATEDWTTTRPETWASGYDRNTLAAVRVITRLLPGMREAGWGRIVNISSLAAWMPPAGRPDYSAAKTAMAAIGASLAKAVAGEGITVNTVSPWTIRSGRLEAAFRKVAADRGLPVDAPWEEVEPMALPMFATVPMQRVGTLDEIGDAVAFLVSPRAGYITSMDIRIDGGAWPGL